MESKKEGGRTCRGLYCLAMYICIMRVMSPALCADLAESGKYVGLKVPFI